MKRFTAFLTAVCALTYSCCITASAALIQTYKPQPTPTPTPVAQETKAPAVSRETSKYAYAQSGKGFRSLPNVYLGTENAVAHITHDGTSNFVVWQSLPDGRKVLLANVLGKYDGYVYMDSSTACTVEVIADGNWTIAINPIAADNRTSFSGTGDYVTGFFTAPTNAWRCTHSGKGLFTVWQYDMAGDGLPALVANAIGNYSDSRKSELADGTYCILVVHADGPWTIKPV